LTTSIEEIYHTGICVSINIQYSWIITKNQFSYRSQATLDRIGMRLIGMGISKKFYMYIYLDR